MAAEVLEIKLKVREALKDAKELANRLNKLEKEAKETGDEFGKTGKDARKLASDLNKTEREARELGDEFVKTDRDAKKMSRSFLKTSRNTKQIGRDFDKAGKRASKFGKIMGGLGALVGVGAGIAGFKKIIEATKVQEEAVAQLESRLLSTRNAVGLTSEELQEFASNIQAATGFGDEAMLNSMKTLLTFTKITGDNFKKTTKLALDMSVVLGTDVKSSILQLGKAVQDPIKGMSSMSRAGVTFTETQLEMAKSMVASNNILGAQQIVLDEVTTQFGDAAEDLRDTLVGASRALESAWGDLFEGVDTSGMVDAFNELTALLQQEDIKKGFADLTEGALAFGLKLAGAGAAIGTFYSDMKSLHETFDFFDSLEEGLDTANEFLLGIIDPFDLTSKAADALGVSFDDVGLSADDAADSIDGNTSALGGNTDALDDNNDSLIEGYDKMSDWGRALEDGVPSVVKLVKEYNEMKKEQKTLRTQLKNLQEEYANAIANGVDPMTAQMGVLRGQIISVATATAIATGNMRAFVAQKAAMVNEGNLSFVGPPTPDGFEPLPATASAPLSGGDFYREFKSDYDKRFSIQEKYNEEVRKLEENRHNLVKGEYEELRALADKRLKDDLDAEAKRGAARGAGRAKGASKAASARNSEFESLVQSLRTEEEAIQESYDRRIQIILSNTAEGSQQREELIRRLNEEFTIDVTADFGGENSYSDELASIQRFYDERRELILNNVHLTEDMRTELEVQLTQERNRRIAELERERIDMISVAGEELFGSLADLARNYAGEQSDVYRALFAASKAFAMAQAIINIQAAISNAGATGGPFPLNLAAMATVAAEMATIVSTIASVTYSGGYDKGGEIKSGEFGLVGEKGIEIIEGAATAKSGDGVAALMRDMAAFNTGGKIENVGAGEAAFVDGARFVQGPVTVTGREETAALIRKILERDPETNITSIFNHPRYAGAFDTGGMIPSGSFGMVNERGFEFVEGPANVTGREDTAALFARLSNAIEGISNGGTRIINVMGDSIMDDYMGSDGAEKKVINIMQRNQSMLRGGL